MALDYNALVKFLKKNKEASQKAAADDQDIALGQLSMLRFCQAKVEAGIVETIPGTAASVKKARQSGDRWEMIAARTNKSVGEVKSLAESAGLEVSGKRPSTKTTPSGGSAASGKPAGRKPASGKPAGRKPAAAASKPGTIIRNRSRRGAGNPS